MSAYKPYPKYTPSDVEWLGDVPEHWIKKAIKWESNVARGASPRPIDDPIYFDEEGEYAWVRIADVTSAGRFLDSTTQRLSSLGSSLSVRLQPGALFLSIAGSVGKPCVTTMKCCIHDGFVYFPSWKSSIDFLYYIFASGEPYKGLGKFGTQLNLNTDTVGGIQVALPPLPEQHQVAAFLDRECGKLDALQAKQVRLIELLKEKRQALISHAVTRGLDPAAKLKPSGIEWLGEVPEHWAVKKLGLIGTFKGGAGFPDDHQGQTESEIPFFKVGDIVNSDGMGVMRQANHTITRETAKLLRAFIFPCGTVVFAKVGAALLLQRYRTLGQASCIDNNMMGMTAGKDTLADFLIYVMPLLDLELIVNPGAVPSINEGQISSQRISLPPLAEQRAIVAHLDEKCGKIDQLKGKAERGIELLKERRSALISAAVTGKIDVREPAN